MRILIVEDEQPIAEDIKEICTGILRDKAESIRCELTLGNAISYLAEKQIDLLILDLNLSGRDGFDILKQMVSYSFQTIVVSANIDRAIEAFEYGVIDFIPKPYNEDRIRKAFDRFEVHEHFQNHGIKYLSVRKMGKIRLIAISEIKFVKGANVYTELYLKNGDKELYDKTLNELSRMLPANFIRVHKSFIVDMSSVHGMKVHGGGRYEIELHSQELLPVSRSMYTELKNKLSGSSE
jgi:DNA-binding LytR/AlgR family response regulator